MSQFDFPNDWVHPNEISHVDFFVSKTKAFLYEMLSVSDQFLEMGYNSHSYSVRSKKISEIKNVENKKIMRSRLRHLESQNWMKIIEDGDQIIWQLEKNGAIQILKLRIRTTKKRLSEGQICLVVFDVPEEIRKTRTAIRKLLKLSGFWMRQKSVWESDLDVIDDLRELVKLVDAEKYIRVYHALDTRQEF